MRYFRVVGTPLLLIALLGLLFWGASWGWSKLSAPLPSPSPTPCVTKEASVIVPQNVTIRVFNGGFTSGLAKTVGNWLKDRQFQVAKVGNTDKRVKTTIVIGNKEQQAVLEFVQAQFRGATIEYDDRVDGVVDVLVGTEYGGAVEEAPLEWAAPGGTVCEAVSPSPSPSASASSPAEQAPAEPTAEPTG